MEYSNEQQRFITKYLEALHRGDAAVFAGAGLSVDSGLMDWKQLLKPIADDLGLNIEQERDLVSLAQFYVNERLQSRLEINRLILDHIGMNAKPNSKHHALARLPIDTYWTINYDKLIEKALEARDKVVDVRYTVKQLNVTRTRRDAVLYKMHGDVDHPDNTVLIRDDYEGYHLRMAPFITALVGDLLNKRFLFLGLSFEDPNLNFVLGRIRAQFSEGGGGEHFCLLRSVQPQQGESAENFNFRKLRQNFFAKDLQRFNITAVFVDEFKHIDSILQEIERRFRRRSIFISGSLPSDNLWPTEEIENFVTELSGALVKQKCQIVTGLGKGIGRDVVTGALTVIYEEKLHFEQHLLVRPFPLAGRDAPQKKVFVEQHRQAMIQQAGIALFLFGRTRKWKDGMVIDASGVYREFQIALEHGLVPIPIGGTGGRSADLYTEVDAKWDQHFPEHAEEIRPYFETLGVRQEQLVNYLAPVLSIIRILQGRM